MGTAQLTAFPFPRLEQLIDAMDVRSLPALLAHLAALQTRATARLLQPGEPDDHLLTAREVADVLRTSLDWVIHAKLPFAVKVSPGQKRYSARGLARYVAGDSR